MALCCPECDSSEVQGHEDESFDAIGVLQCQCCGFAALADDFAGDSEDNPF